MAQIDKPNLHFNTVIYTGNGSSGRTITGVNFQPDMVWGKCRNNGSWHNVCDAVRGVTKVIVPNENSAEATRANGLTAFGTDGFTVGTDGNFNGNNDTYVAWSWKAGGGQGTSNTNGSINTTYTSVNTTAGFSISKYTGNQTAGATVGHGLGVVPKMIIVKNLNDAENWAVYHVGLGSASKYCVLNTNSAEATDNAIWDGATPTSSVFYLGSSDLINNVNIPYVAYCFAEKKGFSKFGSYTGNGNTDGTFVYTGFKPAFFIHKRAAAAGGWYIYDNKRGSVNEIKNTLKAEEPEAEDSNADYNDVDFLSNGVKIREDNNDINASGNKYIYLAFAENPLVGSNDIPATAR